MFLLSFFICRRGPCLRGFSCPYTLLLFLSFAVRIGRPRCVLRRAQCSLFRGQAPPSRFLIGRSPSLPLLSGGLCTTRGCRRQITSGGCVEFVFLVLLFSLWVGLS
ncbi:hypothetical protein BC835DRAFT_1340060 [Cytidiella melzeri]|nr:hypothetical protein BC835DRAFT_1340060 [Cytidiella melzeri]